MRPGPEEVSKAWTVVKEHDGDGRCPWCPDGQRRCTRLIDARTVLIRSGVAY